MVDNYSIPQKNKVADPKPEVEVTIRQAVQEAVQAAISQIRTQGGSIYLYITVNIHF
jgi:hypothetical protein